MSNNLREEDIRELIENLDFKTIRENFPYWTIKSKQLLLKIFEEYESNIITESDNSEDLQFFKVIKIPQDLLEQAKQYI